MSVRDARWIDFEIKNINKEETFEKLCTHLFCRMNHVSASDIAQDYNQLGLEIFPIKVGDELVGFQSKYCGDSSKFYQQAYDSVHKSLSYYSKIDKIIIFTHLNLGGSFRKNSAKRKIENLCKEKNCEVVFFTNVNFEEAFSKYPDIYDYYFSNEKIDMLFMDSVSINDRNFLLSNKYYDLKLIFEGQSEKISSLDTKIKKPGLYVVEGKAGTGKTEILKKIYISYEQMYLDFIRNKKSKLECIDFCIKPIFIRLREINTHDLLSRISAIKSEYGLSSDSCKFVYFFDGIDEIVTEEFIGCISVFKHLIENENTFGIFFSSRLDSANYFIMQNEIDLLKKISINLLDEHDKENYINLCAPLDDREKLIEIVKENKQMFCDIFSLNILCSSSRQVTNDTTIVELIEFNIKNIENLHYRKINLLNLPNPKINCIKEIAIEIAHIMAKSSNIKISIKQMQDIVMKLYPNLDYINSNKIVEILIMMFFDIREDYINIDTYAMFKHKRYYEYFLFLYLKNNMYDDPFILRDLEIFSQRELLISFLLTQELKEAHKSEDLFKINFLGFIISRLTKDYSSLYFNKWINEDMFDDYTQITYYDKAYIDYLCLLSEDEIKSIISNKEFILNSFINSHNNSLLLFSYFLTHNIDLSYLFENIKVDFKNFDEEYAYYKLYEYITGKITFSEIEDYIFELLDILPLLSEKKYISCIRNDCNYNLTIIVKYFIEHEMDNLLKIISNLKMTIDRFDKLCFIMMKDEISWIFPKAKNEDKNVFIKNIEMKISGFSSVDKYYGIYAVDYLIHEQKKKNDIINSYISQYNINHLLTWKDNEPILSILSNSLDLNVNFYHAEYKCVAKIKEVLLTYKRDEEEKCVNDLLDIVNEYIFECSNFFNYGITIFISNVMGYLKFDSLNVRYFIENSSNAKINKFAFIYNIFCINKGYFMQIFDCDYLELLYKESKAALEEYDTLSQKQVMFSNMISLYDKDLFYNNVLKSLNYNVFRPYYSKENLICIREPMALYLMHEKDLLNKEEQEYYLKKNLLQMDVVRNTLYRSYYPDMLKYLYNEIEPSFEYNFDYDVDLMTPIKLNLNSSLKKFDEEFLSASDYNEYNISSIDFWCDCINYLFENQKLDWIYKFLKENYYPSFNATSISCISFLIVAALIKCKHKDKTFFEFVASNMSSEGYFQILFALLYSNYNDLAKKMFRAIYSLIDVMVYYDREHCNSFDYDIKLDKKIMNIIYESQQCDWISSNFGEGMLYQKNPDIYIKEPGYSDNDEYRWNDYNEKWLEFYGHKPKIGKFNIFYKNYIINSVYILSVDEGRGYIPLIDFETGDYKERDYRFALLICDKQIVDKYIWLARFNRNILSKKINN